MAEPIKVLSAGSLRHAFPEIIAAFGRTTGIVVSLSLGPAGLLRERIEAGEPFDLFASANMAHPKRLVSLGLVEEPVCFARNRLCALARADLGLTTASFVDVLSDPSVKIGTSTPGDDPSGDYAFEMLEHIETRHPGIGEALKSRALQLVGGRHSPTDKSTAALIADGDADLFLGYVSNARLLESDPAFGIVDIPPEFSPKIEYGLALRNNAEEDIRQLRDFVLSQDGREILINNGFLPGETLQTKPI
ncbi:molybdate ABC transporter substrate-binding protein [Shinella sp.]|uniref:molybdate ABC transporter substrate-binding protein n=1 Tax=Shinella sp. TaxID=1870904 RepID=UPI003F720BE6